MSHKSYIKNYINFKNRFKGKGKPVHIPPNDLLLAKNHIETRVVLNILRVSIPLNVMFTRMNQLNFNKKRLEYLWDNKLDLSKT